MHYCTDKAHHDKPQIAEKIERVLAMAQWCGIDIDKNWKLRNV